jgi:hypothetical protein
MIIGISGKMGSGKNLVASIINQLTENKFEEKCFAGKLKDIICLLIGCTREQLENRTFKETPLGEEWKCWQYNDCGNSMRWKDHKDTPEWPPLLSVDKVENMINGYQRELTPRLLLQLLGTQCGREIIHPNIWVNALMADYKGQLEEVAGSGMFSRAAMFTKYPNWIITDVRFPNEVKAIHDKDGIVIRVNRPIAVIQELPIHESETALDDYRNFDAYISNHGTIEDLVEKVRAILISKKFI